MDNVYRTKLVKAMELLARTVNDEDVLYFWWLQDGVADGDILDGDTGYNPQNPDEMAFYTDDKTLSELLQTFLDLMARARRDGGLYADGVLSLKEQNRRGV